MEVGYPTAAGRSEILDIHTRQLVPNYLDPQVWADVKPEIVANTDGFSGADLAGIESHKS